MTEKAEKKTAPLGVIHTEMIDGRNLSVDRQEIFRYLGYDREGSRKAPPSLAEFVSQAEQELRLKCRLRYVYRSVTVARDCDSLNFGEVFSVKSESLCRNLQGCSQVFFMAVTLGAEADVLVSRYCRMDMSQGLIAEAAAAAIAEACCEVCCRQLEQTLAEGKRLRPRFSPGYGDFSLTYQKNVIEILDGQRKIGLTLTEQNMLVPTKSVTAVVGVSDSAEAAREKSCDLCLKEDCAYRRVE